MLKKLWLQNHLRYVTQPYVIVEETFNASITLVDKLLVVTQLSNNKSKMKLRDERKSSLLLIIIHNLNSKIIVCQKTP